MNINYIDILVLVPVLWGGFKGFKNGFISEGGTVAALIFGIWAAVQFSKQGGNLLQEYFVIAPSYQDVVAFAIIFLAVVIVSFFVTKILHNIFKAISLEWLNKLLGIVFGTGKYIIILSFVFFLVQTLIQRYAQQSFDSLNQSLFFMPLVHFAEGLLEGSITLPDIQAFR
ncbi:MAG: CvpA family protein [Bacteroidales bacterium]